MALRDIYAQQRCSCFREDGASRRTRLRQLSKRGVYRPRSAGHHVAPLGVGIHVSDPHTVPVSTQFVRNNLRQRGAHMLTHLGANDIDGHATLHIDLEPDNRRKRRACTRIPQIRYNLVSAATRQQSTHAHH